MNIDIRNLIQSAGGSFREGQSTRKSAAGRLPQPANPPAPIRRVPTSTINALKGDWRFPALGARTLSHEVNN